MLRFGVLAFALTGLVGPAIRYATWPPSWFETVTSARVAKFIYDLVFYLWPAQVLAALLPESRLDVFLLALAGNILLFVLMGLVVGAATNSPRQVSVAFGAFCTLFLVFALWGAGFDIQYLAVVPFLLAISVYGIPFWLVAARLGRH